MGKEDWAKEDLKFSGERILTSYSSNRSTLWQPDWKDPSLVSFFERDPKSGESASSPTCMFVYVHVRYDSIRKFQRAVCICYSLHYIDERGAACMAWRCILHSMARWIFGCINL